MNQELERTEELMAVAGKGNKKKKIIIIAVIVAVLAAGAGIFVGLKIHNDNQIKSQLKTGKALLAEGKYEKAIAAFDKVIEMDDKNPRAYEGKADSYVGMGNYKKSIDPYKKAIKNDTKNEKLYDKVIKTSIENKDKKTAKEVIDMMHENVPETKDKDLDHYLEERKAYKEVLEKVYQENILETDNETKEDLLYVDGDGLEENRFACADVDGDGEDELLLEASQTISANMGTYIMKYKGDGKVDLIGRFLRPTILTNNNVKSDPPRQPLTGATISIVSDYTGKADEQGYLWKTWDVYKYDTNTFDGGEMTKLPEGKDKDGNGTIYGITEHLADGPDADNRIFMDDDEYKKWESKYLDAGEMKIDYKDFTQENIQSLDPFSKKKEMKKKAKPGQQQVAGRVEVTTEQKRGEEVGHPEHFTGSNNKIVILHLDREQQLEVRSVGPGYYKTEAKALKLPESFEKYDGKHINVGLYKDDLDRPGDASGHLAEVHCENAEFLY